MDTVMKKFWTDRMGRAGKMLKRDELKKEWRLVRITVQTSRREYVKRKEEQGPQNDKA